MMDVKVHEGNRVVITNEQYSAEFFITPNQRPDFIDGQDKLFDICQFSDDLVEKYTERLSRILLLPDEEFDAMFGDNSLD